MKKRFLMLIAAWAVFAVLLSGFSFAFAASEEIVLTFGGDCVLGTREQWKKKKNTFDTVISRLRERHIWASAMWHGSGRRAGKKMQATAETNIICSSCI